MAIDFNITQYDYSTKVNRVVETHRTLTEAADAVYARAVGFLISNDGKQKVPDPEKYQSFMFTRVSWRKMKHQLAPGHYIIRDPASHIYQLEIWKKSTVSSRGFMTSLIGEYQTERWDRVFDVDIVETRRPYTHPDVIPIVEKSDIETVAKLRKELNKNLESSEVFKKLRTDAKLSELKVLIPGEFRIAVAIPRTLQSMCESTIIESQPDGDMRIYKAHKHW